MQPAHRGPASLPIIDITPFVAGTTGHQAVAEQIGCACRDTGFFYVVGHAVDVMLQDELEVLSRQFFAQDLGTKLGIDMRHGGRAWRGYFPVGAELTSGQPDRKEGIYFGAELSASHPLVQAGTPLHGPNLFPSTIPQFGEIVLAYMSAMTQLGHTLMGAIASSLRLPESYFADRYTADPLVLFRIFNYPAAAVGDPGWGVGEHTDYGVLTILKQDDAGGLQVKSRSGWIDAPPIPNAFVCNIGDMLDRMTEGHYRSTPHRVINTHERARLSFPFFFDPNFFTEVHPIELGTHHAVRDDKDDRWDHASVHAFRGTYGDYLLAKISKVFPDLHRAAVQAPRTNDTA